MPEGRPGGVFHWVSVNSLAIEGYIAGGVFCITLLLTLLCVL